MSRYEELIKQQLLKGDLSKPDHLYGLLISELAEKKEKVIEHLISSVYGYSILDIGGGSGLMIAELDFDSKTVVDKRRFAELANIGYIHEEYDVEKHISGSNHSHVLFSEFLHLFPIEDIQKILSNDQLKDKTVIVIEPEYDDFLDLRLRLWSGGRCVKTRDINQCMGTIPVTVAGYNIWIRE